jgi:phosphosulfolactate synthase (CoM biosynthesis protein A)
VVGTNNKTDRSYTALQGHSLIVDRGDNYQYVRGRFNIPGDYIDVVAYGDNDVPVESDDPTKRRIGRKNLYTLDRKGNATFTGTVSADAPTQNGHLTRKDYVDNKITECLTSAKSYTNEQINALNIA